MAVMEHVTASPRDEWLASVADVLNKGKPPHRRVSADDAAQRLQRQVDELVVQGLYPSPAEPTDVGFPGVTPYRRGYDAASGDMPWAVVGRYTQADPQAVSVAMAEDFACDVRGAELCCGPGFLPVGDVAKLAEQAGEHAVTLWAHRDQAAAATALRDATGHTGGKYLGLDPFAAALLTATEVDVAATVSFVQDAAENTMVFVFDGGVYHDAGGSAPDQVGFAVAAAVDALRKLGEAGVPLEQAWRHVTFRYAVDADQFVNIAMLRAARSVWAAVGAELGVEAAQRRAPMLAVTSTRMMSAVDPWVNMLRGTVATFAAAVGGAGAIAVTPFDAECGAPESFGHRIARNTGLILAQEGHIGQVVDPSAGSGLVEDLTDQICVHAWALLQRCEAVGGMAAAISSGLVADHLEQAYGRRAAELASRKRPLTGVSEFPKLDEERLEREVRPVAPEIEGALPQRRDSEVFEALRVLAEESGAPRVPVVVLGPLKDHTARLGFVRNLLGVAGLGVATMTPEEIAQRCAEDPIMMVAGASGGYAEHGPAAVAALRERGVQHVVAAGRDAEWGESAAVVDEYVNVATNTVEFLMTTLQRYGAAAEADA